MSANDHRLPRSTQPRAGFQLPIVDPEQDGAHFDTADVEPESTDGRSAPSRRDFLKLSGFAVAGAALAGCEKAPVQHAVPYLIAPDDIVPGRSYNYASTCGGCRAACGLLINNRDGRPIKLEGNPDHPLSRGGLCAAGQASLLGLYDRQRLQQPQQSGQPTEWVRVDRTIGAQLDAIRKQKGAVRFLTGPVVGSAKRAMLHKFLDTFDDARHVVLDPRSCSAILDAHARTHGVRVLPHFRFGNAAVIVGFEADFLGTWISPVEFTHAYQLGRKLEGPTPRLSQHVQFESSLSITGSKADHRVCVTPEEMAANLNHLAALLAKKAGVQFQPATDELLESRTSAFLDKLADELWDNQQHSLILCGSQRVELQILVNFLNHILGNYESTVDVVRPSYQAQSDGQGLLQLIQELRDGKVAALFIDQCNPVQDLPSGDSIAESLKKVPLVVSLAARWDETSELAQFVCPDHHYLEAWSDSEPIEGLVTLVQPAITPLGNTRSALESLAIWSGQPRPAYDLLRDHWEKEVFPRQTGRLGFQEFWDRTLHNGFAQVRPRPIKVSPFNLSAVRPASLGKNPPTGTFSLLLYSKVGMPDSSHAYNAWLQELPDPISKVVWDNYACLAPATATHLGVRDGDVVRIEVGGSSGESRSLELPAFVQPGNHENVVAVALGYGSRLSRRFANIGPEWLQARPTVGADGLVGKNAASLLSWVDGNLRFTRDGVRLTKTDRQHPLASTQSYYEVTVPAHLSLPGQERRPIIRETTLSALQDERSRGGHAAADRTAGEGKSGEPLPTAEGGDIWPADHPVTGPRWGMVIDLNACTGCSACVVACQAENNIPVVGKDEVNRHREMHWLRIDRYYTEHDDGVDVAHQPMLCQHCGNAPCEVVCPVLATVHSDEGLNQQVYNRCVGTRYCANNCPYKVRRFNWFDYVHDDLLQNLVLNPDVTVRSRGVMEKCTFCVQRIQEAKSEAGEKIPRDGVIETACQQSCPAHAIVFGNLNDPTSRVSRLAADSRSYQVLGELNIRPSVSYLELVRNRSAEGSEKQHG